DEFTSDQAAAQALLEHARVAAIPGSAFYANGGGSRVLRFCFAKDFDALEEACRRIAAGVTAKS
ncbi:MAG TPA: aminotransferase class I/II-fold pyridoxal phosphate-dependent enzyme, partial [Thermoanaerobaculia bacterium]|nr:aminotransferase class I/II-fold pyridoxal phosphate-dependent enzyme [Thermoanaerobaculia bacterium]